ncbi:NADPH2:quinone reductase [Mytilus galloprovincialis]|uniref:NADPH2:quinone reductase n=2 Tax=Mytilus galloprovincialis TaxID=29158 RepID=A0A8B6CDS3_MYTGA|nr:NADPH2:quinone reductase [Mytilus galloprovincialis]
MRVGLACVQLAKNLGLTVLGTAGSSAGMSIVKVNRCDFVFNHKSDNYTQQIMDATKGEGPDLIIEMLANVNLDKDLNMIKKKGRIVIVGNRGTIEINPRLTMAKECIVTGIVLMNSTPDDWKEMNASIQTGMQNGWVKPHIGQEYRLNQSALAHKDVINNLGAQGKNVIKL